MTGPATRAAAGVLALAAVLLAAVLLAGCADVDADARRQAVDQARATARGAAEALRVVLGAPGAPTGQALLDQAAGRLAGGTDVMVFDQRLTGDGGIVLKAAVHGRGQAGGGGTYTSLVARLCVELDGAPAPAATVTLKDTPCAATLPSATNGGVVNFTTTLQ